MLFSVEVPLQSVFFLLECQSVSQSVNVNDERDLGTNKNEDFAKLMDAFARMLEAEWIVSKF